jgi:hypothetical protein
MTSPSSVLEMPHVVTDREPWTTDPRPDLVGDSAAWSLLLSAAFDADGDIPTGCFGVLHGLRCIGVGLECDERGRWRLAAGEVESAEYDEIRDVWLMPRKRELGELLRRMEVVT